jgi:hypothetical protein
VDFRLVDLGICGGRFWPGDPGRVAIVLPGAHYLPGYPLLWFAREAVQRHGWSVLEVWDEVWEEDDQRRWVEDRAAAALDYAGAGTRALVVAKSVSTFAAPIVAERSLPAVWLTPFFELEPVLDALRRARAPALLVGGTADPLWDSTLVSTLDIEVLELAGVDHALEVEGDPLASLDALRRVTHAVDGFVARL